MEDYQMNFVLRYYQVGKLDTAKALQRTNRIANHHRATAKTIPLWRKVSVAASFTLLIIGGAFAAYTYMAYSPQEDTVTPVNEQTITRPVKTKHFHFDNTPLPEVLKTLGNHYHVVLTATDTNKRLTADFDSEDLQQTIEMIEAVLDEKITISEK